MPEHSSDPILTNALKAKGQEGLGAGMGIAFLNSKGGKEPWLEAASSCNNPLYLKQKLLT